LFPIITGPHLNFLLSELLLLDRIWELTDWWDNFLDLLGLVEWGLLLVVAGFHGERGRRGESRLRGSLVLVLRLDVRSLQKG
jgi:hypothetical protein